MRYEDAVKIEQLAADYHDKRERVRALETASTPTDPEQARAATVAIELARTEASIAFSLLLRAQGEAVEQSRRS